MHSFFVVASAGANILRFLLFVLDLCFGLMVATLVKFHVGPEFVSFLPTLFSAKVYVHTIAMKEENWVEETADNILIVFGSTSFLVAVLLFQLF